MKDRDGGFLGCLFHRGVREAAEECGVFSEVEIVRGFLRDYLGIED